MDLSLFFPVSKYIIFNCLYNTEPSLPLLPLASSHSNSRPSSGLLMRRIKTVPNVQHILPLSVSATPVVCLFSLSKSRRYPIVIKSPTGKAVTVDLSRLLNVYVQLCKLYTQRQTYSIKKKHKCKQSFSFRCAILYLKHLEQGKTTAETRDSAREGRITISVLLSTGRRWRLTSYRREVK